ncbi:TspO/MBR family protein [Salipaludibacillus daqingensis]|uniref:TspO/MBR family protein n=1 Tax=Salipaludibacillus daqingensis TaxID=3041001 RepID=UPI0024763363|nr:tryptophan-rich sensory protein [Salipaludibacillus daqingensis]
MKQFKHKLIYWINVASLVAVIVINALANILPFNNLTTGDISDQLNVLFTPAGYVFSIWSVIYLFLVFWVVRPFFTKHKKDQQAYLNVGYAFLVNAILNIGWLLLFHYEFFVTTLFVMVALLINLIVIYRRIHSVDGTSVWMRLPFSIYIGWISVATIVNVGIFFNTIGFEQGFVLSPEAWSIALLIIALLLGAWFTISQKDVIFPLVFIWAFIGIGLERYSEYPALGLSAFVVAGILTAFTVINFFLNKGYFKLMVEES